MNTKSTFCLSLLLLCNLLLFAQTVPHRNFDLELSSDSLQAQQLEKSLGAFLLEAQHSTYSHEYVDTLHLQEYEFFFRKLSRIKSNQDLAFHPPTILKSYTPDDKNYYLTIAFTGTKNDLPFVYQMTELKAVPYQGHYRFYCLFEERTAHFRNRKIKNVTFHYRKKIDETKAIAFADFKEELANLTQTSPTHLDYYCFESLDELLKAYGFLYSARQCNFLCYDLGFTDRSGEIYLTGTDNENYRFGYLGDYLYYHLPNEQDMYWPFVNGVATYYGGYALSYHDLPTLKKQFRDKLQAVPEIDFLVEFKKGRKSSVKRHFSYYVMSAFLCEAVMKQKGFKEVLQLVYSGKRGERFFENLKKVLDIDESNFHETIVRLIHETSSPNKI